CGPIGLLVVQLARASGSTSVLAVEPLAHRRQAALDYGADVGLAPEEAATHPGGFDVAFEVAGTDAAVETAMQLVRPGARVVLAGIPDDDRTSFSAGLARRKGLSLIMVRRMKDVYPRAIALVQRRLVDVESLVTARYPLERADDAFAAAVQRE